MKYLVTIILSGLLLVSCTPKKTEEKPTEPALPTESQKTEGTEATEIMNEALWPTSQELIEASTLTTGLELEEVQESYMASPTEEQESSTRTRLVYDAENKNFMSEISFKTQGEDPGEGQGDLISYLYEDGLYSNNPMDGTWNITSREAGEKQIQLFEKGIFVEKLAQYIEKHPELFKKSETEDMLVYSFEGKSQEEIQALREFLGSTDTDTYFDEINYSKFNISYSVDKKDFKPKQTQLDSQATILQEGVSYQSEVSSQVVYKSFNEKVKIQVPAEALDGEDYREE